MASHLIRKLHLEAFQMIYALKLTVNVGWECVNCNHRMSGVHNVSAPNWGWHTLKPCKSWQEWWRYIQSHCEYFVIKKNPTKKESHRTGDRKSLLGLVSVLPNEIKVGVNRDLTLNVIANVHKARALVYLMQFFVSYVAIGYTHLRSDNLTHTICLCTEYSTNANGFSQSSNE